MKWNRITISMFVHSVNASDHYKVANAISVLYEEDSLYILIFPPPVGIINFLYLYLSALFLSS